MAVPGAAICIFRVAAGGFALWKWDSNYPDCLQNCSPEHCDQPLVKLLGYLYNIQKDTLQLKLTFLDLKVSTRLCILSQIFQIFKPLWFQNLIFGHCKFVLRLLHLETKS